ncbi:hypothetical protein C2S51_017371, partial [Perilla frutescens var. frutescens]
MLDTVKLRFNVSPIAEKWILSSIGHKWRNWKHFLKTKYWTDVPIENLIDDRDERVLLDQWIKLPTYWSTDEVKKVSKRNKDARDKKIMNQRTGKTSFAQIRAKLAAMQEYTNQLPEGYNDPIGPSDVFAQVMGQDKSGHVRMLGQGICPSDVWGESPRYSSNHLLMQKELRILELEAMLSAQQGYVSQNWCEVYVMSVLELEETLIRPYGKFQKLKDTFGEMIAWPCSL